MGFQSVLQAFAFITSVRALLLGIKDGVVAQSCALLLNVSPPKVTRAPPLECVPPKV